MFVSDVRSEDGIWCPKSRDRTSSDYFGQDRTIFWRDRTWCTTENLSKTRTNEIYDKIVEFSYRFDSITFNTGTKYLPLA